MLKYPKYPSVKYPKSISCSFIKFKNWKLIQNILHVACRDEICVCLNFTMTIEYKLNSKDFLFYIPENSNELHSFIFPF